MPNQQTAGLDAIFHGLADPTRRAVLERLTSGPAPVSELARRSNLALPSFMQHLRVLEDCGLVGSHKAGRVRTYQLKPQRLTLAEGWLQTQRAQWDRRLDQLDAYLGVLKDKQP